MTLTLINSKGEETIIDLNPQAIILYGKGRPGTAHAAHTFIEIMGRDEWIWVKDHPEQINRMIGEYWTNRNEAGLLE